MSLKTDIEWFNSEFGRTIEGALSGKKYKKNFVISLACKEMRYLWSPLHKKGYTTERILELMVGDTINGDPVKKTGRKAFPPNRSVLENYLPGGKQMFLTARKALEDIASNTTSYQKEVRNPDKFVRGYGIFQYDLQFFHKDSRGDTGFFLEKKWTNFGECLDRMILELDEKLTGLKRKFPQLKIDASDRLTFDNSVFLAIAYNAGLKNMTLAKKFKQGHQNKASKKFYGEEFAEFLTTVKDVVPDGN